MDAELTPTRSSPARRRRISEETRHILIGGAVVLLAIVLFAFSAGSDGGALGSYRLVANFTSAEGVFVDSPVRLAGVQIGRVSEMQYDSGREMAVVTMEIEPSVELPLDSIAVVTSEGMIGRRFIRIEAGGDTEMLKDGDRLEYTQGSIMFEDLLAKVIDTVEKNRRAQRKKEHDAQDGGTSQ